VFAIAKSHGRSDRTPFDWTQIGSHSDSNLLHAAALWTLPIGGRPRPLHDSAWMMGGMGVDAAARELMSLGLLRFFHPSCWFERLPVMLSIGPHIELVDGTVPPRDGNTTANSTSLHGRQRLRGGVGEKCSPVWLWWAVHTTQ